MVGRHDVLSPWPSKIWVHMTPLKHFQNSVCDSNCLCYPTDLWNEGIVWRRTAVKNNSNIRLLHVGISAAYVPLFIFLQCTFSWVHQDDHHKHYFWYVSICTVLPSCALTETLKKAIMSWLTNVDSSKILIL